MDLSVPGVRSPVWTRITVWQFPHRQIWCDPRWRTGSQPRSPSLRINVRAVTAPVYLDRRYSVQSDRRYSVQSDRRSPLVGGVSVAFGTPDGEAEEVAEPANVTSRDEGLVGDAVLTAPPRVSEGDGVLAEASASADRAGAGEGWFAVVDPEVHLVGGRSPDGRLGGRRGDAQLGHRAAPCVVLPALEASRTGEGADPAPVEDLSEIAGYPPRGC